MDIIKTYFIYLSIGVIFFMLGIMASYFLLVEKQSRQAAAQANHDLALYLYGKVTEKFGSVCTKNSADANIIDGIQWYKDLDFAIYTENGVKTIRTYGCDSH